MAAIEVQYISLSVRLAAWVSPACVRGCNRQGQRDLSPSLSPWHWHRKVKVNRRKSYSQNANKKLQKERIVIISLGKGYPRSYSTRVERGPRGLYTCCWLWQDLGCQLPSATCCETARCVGLVAAYKQVAYFTVLFCKCNCIVGIMYIYEVCCCFVNFCLMEDISRLSDGTRL